MGETRLPEYFLVLILYRVTSQRNVHRHVSTETILLQAGLYRHMQYDHTCTGLCNTTMPVQAYAIRPYLYRPMQYDHTCTGLYNTIICHTTRNRSNVKCNTTKPVQAYFIWSENRKQNLFNKMQINENIVRNDTVITQ